MIEIITNYKDYEALIVDGVIVLEGKSIANNLELALSIARRYGIDTSNIPIREVD